MLQRATITTHPKLLPCPPTAAAALRWRPPHWCSSSSTTHIHQHAGLRLLRCHADPEVVNKQQQHSYVIRGIDLSDVPKLAAIEQQCKEFSACWSAADIEAELDNSLSRAAVAVDSTSNEPLGYIVCWLVAGELQVCSFLCANSYCCKHIQAGCKVCVWSSCLCL